MFKLHVLMYLFLVYRDIMDKIKPVVNMVLQQESKTRWSRHHVPEIKADRKRNEAGQSGPEDDFQDLINDEPLNRIWDSILHNSDVEQLGPGIGQLLVDQARATITMKRAVGKVRERFTADLIQAELDIRLRHPMLSLVKPWMDKQLYGVKVRSCLICNQSLCINSGLHMLFRRSSLKNTNGSATKKPLRHAAASHLISLFIFFHGTLPSSEMYKRFTSQCLLIPQLTLFMLKCV